MFYAVQQVSDHPCFKMQELIYSVFYSAVQGRPFGKDVFPDRFTKTAQSWRYFEGIKNRFAPLYADLLALGVDERKRIYSQLIDNNMIELFCADRGLTPDNDINYDSGIGEQIKKILSDCYDKLDLSHFRRPGCKVKPRYRYYQDYISLNKSVCPFCGINLYKNPLNPRREDFDHYLLKSKYPLSAANMDNLIPMCTECNQDFKKQKDILYDGTKRVVAFYPFTKFSGVNIQVSSTVQANKPFTRYWQVELTAIDPVEADKVDNWDRVFLIKHRLVKEIKVYFEEWMTQELKEKNTRFVDIVDFRTFMGLRSQKWSETSNRRMEPKALLKMAFFKYIETGVDEIFIESYMRMHNENLLKR